MITRVRLVSAITIRITNAKEKCVAFFWNKIVKKPFYRRVPFGQLSANFFFQRILRINADVPFSTSFTSRIQGFGNIVLNDPSHSARISFAVSGGCYFTVFKGTTLEIGKDCLWAFNVCIQTGNHDVLDRGKYKVGSIRIGDNCWIGNAVTILPGVHLGDNVTIGANSVVTNRFSEIPFNCVIAGNPAKIIKQL
jgi:acetyltransferase-like isoleucine patch superfamily enzyme